MIPSAISTATRVRIGHLIPLLHKCVTWEMLRAHADLVKDQVSVPSIHITAKLFILQIQGTLTPSDPCRHCITQVHLHMHIYIICIYIICIDPHLPWWEGLCSVSWHYPDSLLPQRSLYRDSIDISLRGELETGLAIVVLLCMFRLATNAQKWWFWFVPRLLAIRLGLFCLQRDQLCSQFNLTWIYWVSASVGRSGRVYRDDGDGSLMSWGRLLCVQLLPSG